jgi:hypothetical protein
MTETITITVPAEKVERLRSILQLWEECEAALGPVRTERFFTHLIDACDQLWAYTADARREKQSE